MGGAEGVRTPDPRLAKPVLYQLSYRPDAAIMPGQTPGPLQPGNIGSKRAFQ